MMLDFKNNPVTTIDGSKEEWIEDYNTSTAKNIITGEEKEITIPKSNVLIYIAKDGTKMAARPSGTEPKIKFYFSVNASLEKAEDYKEINSQLEDKINRILKELNLN